MNIFRVECDGDQFRELDFPDDARAAIGPSIASNASDEFDSDEILATDWTRLQLEWASYGKRLKRPDITGVNWLNAFAVFDDTAIALFSELKESCELLPIMLEGSPKAHSIHIFSTDAFPRGYDHGSIIGDFATKVDTQNVRPLFRDRIHLDGGTTSGRGAHYPEDTDVPGVYIYCTDEFVARYEEFGLTGLYFEPYWPLNDRLEFFRDTIREDAAARERGRLMDGNSSDSSPMAKGRVRKPKITWKDGERPSLEQLAAYLWQSIIDERMNGRWLGDATGANTPDAIGITQLAAEAVTQLLDRGADRNVLCHLARAVCFEAITRTFATLEETGIQWPDDEVDWESLQIAMTQEATLGKDGKLGGWPGV